MIDEGHSGWGIKEMSFILSTKEHDTSVAYEYKEFTD